MAKGKNKCLIILIISLSVNLLLFIGFTFFFFQYVRFEARNEWHRIKYHEYRILDEYKTKYKPGTRMAFVKKHERNNIQDIFYQNEKHKLWISPKIEDSENFQHYCGYTFIFDKNELLIDITVNSPCH
jgi:hypothetical protein